MKTAKPYNPEPVGYSDPRIEKTAVSIQFPQGFDPQVEYTPEGDAIVRMRVTVREIEAQPFRVTEEWNDFLKRADISESISENAFECAFKAFHKEFAKGQVLAKLKVNVED